MSDKFLTFWDLLRNYELKYQDSKIKKLIKSPEIHRCMKKNPHLCACLEGNPVLAGYLDGLSLLDEKKKHKG